MWRTRSNIGTWRDCARIAPASHPKTGVSAQRDTRVLPPPSSVFSSSSAEYPNISLQLAWAQEKVVLNSALWKTLEFERDTNRRWFEKPWLLDCCCEVRGGRVEAVVTLSRILLAVPSMNRRRWSLVDPKSLHRRRLSSRLSRILNSFRSRRLWKARQLC